MGPRCERQQSCPLLRTYLASALLAFFSHLAWLPLQSAIGAAAWNSDGGPDAPAATRTRSHPGAPAVTAIGRVRRSVRMAGDHCCSGTFAHWTRGSARRQNRLVGSMQRSNSHLIRRRPGAQRKSRTAHKRGCACAAMLTARQYRPPPLSRRQA